MIYGRWICAQQLEQTVGFNPYPANVESMMSS